MFSYITDPANPTVAQAATIASTTARTLHDASASEDYMAEKTKSQVMGAHLRVTAAAGMFVAALAVGGCHNANRVEDPNARYIATLTCRVRAEMASMLRSGAPAGHYSASAR